MLQYYYYNILEALLWVLRGLGWLGSLGSALPPGFTNDSTRPWVPTQMVSYYVNVSNLDVLVNLGSYFSLL